MGLLGDIAVYTVLGPFGFVAYKLVCTLVVTIAERITANNLAFHSRKTLENDAEGAKLLAEAIEIKVEKKQGKVLHLSAIRNREKVADIQMEALEVADDVYEGLTAKLTY